MRKRSKGDLLSTVAIIVGILILLYPTISNFLVERNASRAVSNYDAAVSSLTDERYAQMLAEALHLELEGLDRERVLDLKGKNDDEALYRYLLITQCNALAGVLPGLFQRLDAETSLLLSLIHI